MKNITLAIDEEALAPFSALVKKSSADWLDDMFEQMDKENVSSKGEKWTREELYRG